MLNAEEILKRAEKKSKKFSHFQTKGLPSSGKDRPWQNNEVTPEKVTSITITEDNIMNDNLKVPENQTNISREETGRKLVDNREKSGRNSETILRQSRDNPETNLVQTGPQNNLKAASDTIGTQLVHTSDTIGTQLVHNSYTHSYTIGTQNKHSKDTFALLGKAQKAIVLTIYNSCKSRVNEVSGYISLEDLIKCCNLSKFSIKTTLLHFHFLYCSLQNSKYPSRQNGS